MDWRMGLASLVTIPAALIPMISGLKTYNSQYAAYMKANNRVNSVIVEYVEGIEVVKAFNQASSSYEKFTGAVRSFKEFTMAWFESTWKSMNLCFAILPTTLLWTLPVGVALYLDGSMGPAELALCFMLALGIVTPLLKATQFLNEAKSMEYAVRDANHILQLPELKEAPKPAQLAVSYTHLDVYKRQSLRRGYEPGSQKANAFCQLKRLHTIRQWASICSQEKSWMKGS